MDNFEKNFKKFIFLKSFQKNNNKNFFFDQNEKNLNNNLKFILEEILQNMEEEYESDSKSNE